MPYELTLTIIGNVPEQVVAPSGRFSIGRSNDNDLIVSLTGVSRRHALITHYDDGTQITDCGSQNGTFVNGRQIHSAVELHDGDTISLGSVCEIRVNLRQQSETNLYGSDHQWQNDLDRTVYYGSAERRQEPVQPPDLRNDRTPFRLDPPRLAMISIAAIILLAALTVLILKLRGAGRENDFGYTSESPLPDTPRRVETPTPTPPCEALTLSDIQTAAEQVVRRVSNDSAGYAFPADPSHATNIKAVVERNCYSTTLGATLRQLRNAGAQLNALTENQIDPDLLEYATLAETGGTSPDPLSTARRIAPQLIAVSVLLKDRNAETSLLLLAAFRMGPPASGRHPILDRMRNAGINTGSERNVWDLYSRGGLNSGEYDFVIRFLAFGILAYEPRRFGIDLALDSSPDPTLITCSTGR